MTTEPDKSDSSPPLTERYAYANEGGSNFMAQRTAQNSAGFLQPYLNLGMNLLDWNELVNFVWRQDSLFWIVEIGDGYGVIQGKRASQGKDLGEDQMFWAFTLDSTVVAL